MIPADDVEVGVRVVSLAGDFFPRVMSVGEARLAVLVVLGFERLGDPNERLARHVVDAFLAEQDASQLDRGIPKRVSFDRVGGLEVNEDG